MRGTAEGSIETVLLAAAFALSMLSGQSGHVLAATPGIIGHGRSNAYAIKQAVGQARRMVAHDVVAAIAAGLAAAKSTPSRSEEVL